MRKIRLFVMMMTLVLGIGFCGFGQDEVAAAKRTTSPAQQQANMKMIWDYKEQLELSDNQITGIKEAMHNFEQDILRLRSKLQTNELELQDLIQKKADLDNIKQKLNTSAAIQVDMRMDDIMTARKIDTILSPNQLNIWKEIQAKEASKNSLPPARKAQTETP